LRARSDTPRLSRDHRLVFGSQLALGGGGLAVAGTSVATAAGSLDRAPHHAHRLAIAGLHVTYPAVNVAAAVLLALASIGATVLARLARGVWSQLRRHRSFVRGLAVVGPLAGRAGVWVIDDPRAHAFCAGYLRPAVYVSRGALELLSAEELDAVLLHEAHHRAARDPLRFALARILSQALFFLPALAALGDRLHELAEQRADAAAVLAAGERAPLASALLAFDAAAPTGAAGISPERVDALIGRPTPRRLPHAPIAISLAVLCGTVAVVWRAAGAATAHASLDLPAVSQRPCVLVLALLAAAAIGATSRFSQIL
jgi:hypothetical protein